MTLTIDLLAAICFFIGWVSPSGLPAWNWTNGDLFFVTLVLAF